MKTEEILLGFDWRQGVEVVAANWDAKRREDFLFRIDATQPLSTDTIVWPAVLDSESRPGVCVGHQDLWSDLQCLRACSQALGIQLPDHGSLIAVTLHLSESDKVEWELGKSADPPTTPSVRDESWSLVGYDVSDRWLLSGLSNCGFVPSQDDKEALRRQWSGKLNQHHLFTHLENATQFRQLSNRRAAEHGPFFVFGIWFIPTISTHL
jgi:hypothetical protein